MPEPAIRVENIGKRYRITGSGQGGYTTFREALANAARAPLRRFSRGTTEDFWALNGVSFEVQPGEVVGIIGRNGAGKSTLLKILSRITKPTTGRIELNGRVGSLLEVGTGFHPELTGRENVYLNGAILGMTRREIRAKFDEIVAFSEVEQFLDTPVKRYSSGMYVRLAFAVAAHLEPEILIVDEVLAVGDATFQKKCLDRLRVLAESGLSILFVSHSIDQVPRLCEQAVWLDKGRIHAIGRAEKVCSDYLSSHGSVGSGRNLSDIKRVGTGVAKFVEIELRNAAGDRVGSFETGTDLTVVLGVDSGRAINDAALAVNLCTVSGARVFSSWTRELGHPVSLRAGLQYFSVKFSRINLRPGHKFVIMLFLEGGDVLDYIEEARVVDVVDGPTTSRYSTDLLQGFVLCESAWTAL